MKKSRKLEIEIGMFFILATLTFSTGNAMMTKALTENINIVPQMGMVLEFINSIAVIAIGWLSYKVLIKHETIPNVSVKKESVMKGYVISRIIEGLLLTVGTISVLLNLQNILLFRTYSFLVAMLVLGIYSILYCKFLLEEKLVPKWLAITGIVGYVSLAMYSVLGLVMGSSDVFMWLFAPGAVFEIIFPIYLIAKGFRKTEI